MANETVRQHLARLHKSTSEHHSTMAKVHKAAMEEDESEQGPTNEHNNKFHRGAMAAHEKAAEDHAEMCRDCEKAVSAGDFSKLVPDRVSSVTPTAPAFGSSVRPVLRTGQREFEKPNVPLEFRSLVEVEDTLD
jgi:hypothetical protein